MINTYVCSMKAIQKHCGKNTFRWMNEVFGFNYKKPFIMNFFIDNFTIKQIWEVIPHIDYDYTVCLLVNKKGIFESKFYAVELFRDKINIELKSKTYFPEYKTYPDTFWRKSDFENYRKSNEVQTYIIAQRKEYTNERKIPDKYSTYGNYPINDNDRYIIDKYWYCINTHNTKRWINRVDLVETTNNGNKKTVNVPSVEKQSDLFDHSGYYVFNRREELKRKAAAIKANREKEKYNKTDYSNQIEYIKSIFIEKKKYIANMLLKVSNHEQMQIVDKMVSGLRYISFDIDLFIKRTINREYPSNETATKAYNNIIEKLNNIKWQEE